MVPLKFSVSASSAVTDVVVIGVLSPPTTFEPVTVSVPAALNVTVALPVSPADNWKPKLSVSESLEAFASTATPSTNRATTPSSNRPVVSNDSWYDASSKVVPDSDDTLVFTTAPLLGTVVCNTIIPLSANPVTLDASRVAKTVLLASSSSSVQPASSAKASLIRKVAVSKTSLVPC